MHNLYEYVLDNFTLSPEAQRMFFNLCTYVAENFQLGDGGLELIGLNILDHVLCSALGITREEIEEYWNYKGE